MNIVLLPQHTQNIITLTDSILLNHLHQVLKAQIGDSIKVGVVQGNLGTAVIDNLTDTSVTLNHIDCPTPPPTKLPLTVVLALPRPRYYVALFLT